ncbi:MAG: hypothetical protein QG653_650 [Patescibacteria group bacterium]|nr:hypothetical protein [Patescibacteria group bacterium]
MEPTSTTTAPQAQEPIVVPIPMAPPSTPPTQTEEGPVIVEIVEKIPGGYSWTRHLLLVVLILLSVIIIASLIYLNGKSIYQYGL